MDLKVKLRGSPRAKRKLKKKQIYDFNVTDKHSTLDDLVY